MAKIDRTKGSIRVPKANLLPGSLGAGPGLAAARGGQQVSATGQQLVEASMKANEAFFAQAKQSRQTAEYSKAYRNAIMDFNQGYSNLLMNPYDEDGNPLLDQLPGRVGALGQEALDRALEGVSDPQVQQQLTENFSNYYTQQQVTSFGTARRQQIDYTRAEVGSSIDTLANQAIIGGLEKMQMYDAQVRDMLEGAGVVFSEQEKEALYKGYINSSRAGVVQQMIKADPNSALQVLQGLDAGTLGVDVPVFEKLVEQAQAGAADVERQAAKAVKQQEAKLSADQKALADKLEQGLVLGQITEGALYEHRDKLPVDTFTKLIEKSRRIYSKELQKIETIKQVSTVINQGGTIEDKFSPSEINTFYHYMVQVGAQANPNEKMTLVKKAGLVTNMKGEVTDFTKEIKVGLVDGDAIDAFQSLKYLEEQGNYSTLRALDEKSLAIYARLKSRFNDTNLSLKGSKANVEQMVLQIRDEVLNPKSEVQTLIDKNFKRDFGDPDDLKNAYDDILDDLGIDPIFFEPNTDIKLKAIFNHYLKLGYQQTGGDKDAAIAYATDMLRGVADVSEISGKKEFVLYPIEKTVGATVEEVQRYLAENLEGADNLPLNEDGTINAEMLSVSNSGIDAKDINGKIQYEVINLENGAPVIRNGVPERYIADSEDFETMRREDAKREELEQEIKVREEQKLREQFAAEENTFIPGDRVVRRPSGPNKALPKSEVPPNDGDDMDATVEKQEIEAQPEPEKISKGEESKLNTATSLSGSQLKQKTAKMQKQLQPLERSISEAPNEIPDSIGSNPAQVAGTLMNLNEKTSYSQLNAFMKKYGGFNIDVRKTAWCAAFVNSVLGSKGIKGTGKLNAKSFLNWGKSVDVSKAKSGDIVVFDRPPVQWQGHVGFYAGREYRNYKGRKQWVIAVLGGNQGDAVNISYYPESRLRSVRRAG